MRTLVHLAVALVATASITSQSLASAAPCGDDVRYASTVKDAQLHSLVGLAIAARPEELNSLIDGGGRKFSFIGNAFLIDRLPFGVARRTAFFATARHNLAEICASAHDGNAAEFWIVYRDASGVRSKSAESLSASACSAVEAEAARAGATESEVVYMPDVGIVVVDDLPGADWKPMLLGTSDNVGFSTGAETLQADLSPWSGQRNGLPNRSPHRDEIPNSEKLRAVLGNFPGGASGSPYIGDSGGGRPIVLGIVTNSIPTNGLPMVGPNVSYTAPMMKAWIEKSWANLQGNAFSLIFLSDSLIDRFEAGPYGEAISSAFTQAGKEDYLPPVSSRDMLVDLARNSQIALLAIRQQCEAGDEETNRFALKVLFCGRLALASSQSQCLFDTERYQDEMAPRIAEESRRATVPQARQLANVARQTLSGSLGKSDAGTAGLAANVLAATVDKAAPQSGVVRSKILFDLALAEKAAGGTSEAYLLRLDEAVSADASNIQAARAYVDAAAKSASPDAAAKGLRLIADLQKNGNLSAPQATRTREMLVAVSPQ